MNKFESSSESDEDDIAEIYHRLPNNIKQLEK